MNKNIKYLFMFLPLLLFLQACSSPVSGVDREVYNKSKKYATELVNYEDSISLEKLDDIEKFLETKPSTDEEKDLLETISKLFVLNTLGKAETVSGHPTDETEKQIQETIDYLNEEYKMNIE